jgi:ATP-binding cassette subfamily B protein
MNKEVYRYIWRTYGRNPGLWFGLAAEIIRTLLNRVWTVVVMAQATAAIAVGDRDGAERSILILLAIQIAGTIIGLLGELVSINSENKEYDRLLRVYHHKLTGKDMAFYRNNQTGYLASVFRQYLDSAMFFVRFLRGEVIRTIISLTIPAIILLYVDWRVGVSAVIIVALQLVYVMWSSAKANKYRALSHEIYRKITGEVSDEITNIVAFKSGGVENEAQGKIAQLAKEEVVTFWLRRKTTTLLDLPRSLLNAVGVSVALYFAVTGSSSSPEAAGFIVLTVTYMFQIMRNVSEVPTIILQHDDLVTKLYPTLQYLESTYENIRDPEHPKPLHIPEGQIDITNVDFSYPAHSGTGERISVFKNLTIHIQGGEQVGVVGLSGAGKSTLASLLMRFDDIDAGAITIDGIDIRDVRQSELRQKIAYVPQEPLLFHRTIKENIAYFNDQASHESILRAAQAAHAHGFIAKLPDGYDTMVGERGVKLSGGQKQRVVIARAILKNAPIMVFDEATSALDSESEHIIQRAMPEIIGKQTAVVIAHRLSTVARLDRIIVMHEGAIVEEGKHEELLKLQGRYYALWQKQIKSETAR